MADLEPVDASSEAALRAVVRAIEGVQDPDPRLTGLLGSALALLHPTDEQGRLTKAEDHEGRVAVALMKAQEIASSLDVAPSVRESARETARSLQVTQLAKSNPRAAAEWELLHPAA
jgi:hypothetical protein